jgi:signal transduction histidine kinase
MPCEPCRCDAALAEGQLLESEWVFADGTSYQLNDYPFVDVDGVEKVLHLGIDITKRRQAEAELERANQELLALSQVEHRERILAESLAQAALALNSSLDSAQVLDRLLEQTLRVVPCTAASVMLIENQEIQLMRQRGLEFWTGAEKERFEAGVPLESMPRLQAACRTHQPMLIEDTRRDPQAGLADGLEWVRSLLALPMIQGDSVIGFITLLSDRAGFFAEESVLPLGSFASHAALAIGNARLYQSMKESREQLQSLSRRLVEVQEHERRYVARELHDEAGQALTSLMIQLKLLQRDAADPDRVQAGIAELMGEVEAVMENLHRLAMDLRPASLDHLGLIAALDQYCQTLAQQHTIQVAFEVMGIEGRVAPKVETALYRIVQEALNNVIRHGQATRVDVLLERRGDRIVAIIEDDGRGFDPETAAGPDRLGLVGIQERAMALGGSLTIESSPSEGTAIFVEVPHAYPGSDRG